MKKIAYLTIDDAPSADFMRKVHFLKSREIPAVFFCLGMHLERRKEMAAVAVQEGYIIANHGYDHRPFSELSMEECRIQIERTDALIQSIYNQAGLERNERFFRFPYGDKGGYNGSDAFSVYSEKGLQRKNTIQLLLRQMKYTQPPFSGITYSRYRNAGLLEDIDWYWTFDTMDWSITSSQPVDEVRTLSDALRRMEQDNPEDGLGLNDPVSEEIILIHDHPDSGEIFEALVDRLLVKGFDLRLPAPGSKNRLS